MWDNQPKPHKYCIMEQRGDDIRAFHRKMHEFVCYDDHAASNELKRWGLQETSNACDSDGSTRNIDLLRKILSSDKEVCGFFWGKSKYYYERAREKQ